MPTDGKPNRAARGRDPGQRYRVTAVSRAAEALRSFSAGRPRRTPTDIASAMNVSHAAVARTLATFEKYDFVRRSADGESYQLGWAWLHLADVRQRQFDIRRVALPVMRRMRDAVNETAILSIRSGDRRVNIDYVESSQLVRRITQRGLEAPLHVGAAGRALLSGLGEDELARYLESPAFLRQHAKKTVSKAALLAELEDIHRKGYAAALAELTLDTAAVAAPVRDHSGKVVAALTLSCPLDRFSPKLKKACTQTVLAGAHELSAMLGHAPVART